MKVHYPTLMLDSILVAILALILVNLHGHIGFFWHLAWGLGDPVVPRHAIKIIHLLHSPELPFEIAIGAMSNCIL